MAVTDLDSLVLRGYIPNDGFIHKVQQLLESQLVGSGGRIGYSADDALGDHSKIAYARYCGARPQSDQLMFANWLLSSALGDSDNFNPGPTQREFLARIGVDGHQPRDPRALLEEMVAWGMKDALAERGARATSARATADMQREVARGSISARQELERLRLDQHELTKVSAENGVARAAAEAQVEALTNDLAVVTAERNQLRKDIPELEEAKKRAVKDRERAQKLTKAANNRLSENGLPRVTAGDLS